MSILVFFGGLVIGLDKTYDEDSGFAKLVFTALLYGAGGPVTVPWYAFKNLKEQYQNKFSDKEILELKKKHKEEIKRAKDMKKERKRQALRVKIAALKKENDAMYLSDEGLSSGDMGSESDVSEDCIQY